MTKKVRAKKHLGQHFLTRPEIAKRIADTLSGEGYDQLIEIGPGMGVLTQFLVDSGKKVIALEIDSESVAFLEQHFQQKNLRVIEADFLKCDLDHITGGKSFAITGNFPYNISTQIVFRALQWRESVPEFSGMFQKEVAQRICAGPGSKVYGILSVLTQAFYDAEYLFTVKPGVFNPPPKVDSGVLRLTRKEQFRLDCDEELLFKLVKAAFQQRRKTLKNSLKSFPFTAEQLEDTIFVQRPEQLSVDDFVRLTQMIDPDAVSTHH